MQLCFHVLPTFNILFLSSSRKVDSQHEATYSGISKFIHNDSDTISMPFGQDPPVRLSGWQTIEE